MSIWIACLGPQKKSKLNMSMLRPSFLKIYFKERMSEFLPIAITTQRKKEKTSPKTCSFTAPYTQPAANFRTKYHKLDAHKPSFFPTFS